MKVSAFLNEPQRQTVVAFLDETKPQTVSGFLKEGSARQPVAIYLGKEAHSFDAAPAESRLPASPGVEAYLAGAHAGPVVAPVVTGGDGKPFDAYRNIAGGDCADGTGRCWAYDTVDIQLPSVMRYVRGE